MFAAFIDGKAFKVADAVTGFRVTELAPAEV
jgi:hypothetical protein